MLKIFQKNKVALVALIAILLFVSASKNTSYAVVEGSASDELQQSAANQQTEAAIGEAVRNAQTEVISITCDSGQAPLYDKAGKPLGCIAPPQKLNYDASGKVIGAVCQTGDQAYYKDTSGVVAALTGGFIGASSEFAGCIAPAITTTRGANPCDTGYKPTNGICKAGDNLMSCLPTGNLCVAPLNPSGSKISQQLHEYQTKYTLPCQPLAGGQCASDQTPAGYIARLYQFGLMVVGLFAFGAIIYGALKYILSAGSIVNQSDATDQITQAVLGLVLLLGSFLILYTINPEITNLRNPNLEVIQIQTIIKAGEADNSGTQKPLTGGAGSSDSLCKLAVNAQIGLNIGADFSDSGNGTLFDPSGTQLPSGNQATSKCISCKDNATKGSSGVCACNSGYIENNGECLNSCGSGFVEFEGKCITEASCLAKPGYSAVAGPTSGVGNQCKLVP